MRQNELVLDKDFRIVKYENKYAAATAIMWQNSRKGWMGATLFSTEQDVITDEENSVHIDVWLAIDKEKVVGYCNLYEYQEDIGALYIGLLNVCDDYHGKKIGKTLLLNAINRTIELGWDRLDLYTWSGNNKAIPLYKKSGFFWEDRDDITHLINFIPSVLKNELVKDYFNTIDWYADSVRKIEVKPDGRKENEFDYLTYEWQKADKHLLMEFCRRGRGLRKIETDQFSIEATVENLKLVFGNSYKIRYDIINKTPIPFKLKFRGENDKNIVFNFARTVNVKDRSVIEADFIVNTIEKEQSEWKSHPCVISEIEIDGKTTEIKVGIEPKFPAKIHLQKEDRVSFTEVESDIYIDIENSFDEEATFNFSLPDCVDVEFVQKSFSIVLQAKERRSISTKYILHRANIYSPEIIINAVRKGQELLKFPIRVNVIFHTLNDIFFGKTQTQYVIGNGQYHVSVVYKEFLNTFSIGNMASNRSWISFRYPKIGKPFSDEFNKKTSEKVEFIREDNAIVMKLDYCSEKFTGLNFTINHRLFASGVVERWLEFENIGYNSSKKLVFKDSFGVETSNLFVHYDNEIIELTNDVEGGCGNWIDERMSENWLFKKLKKSSVGICWADDVKIRFGDSEKFFQYDLSALKLGEKMVFKPITIALDLFEDVHKFREFSLKKRLISIPTRKDLEFMVNGGNPFVKDKILLTVIEKKKKIQSGEICVKLRDEMISIGEFSQSNPIIEKQIHFHSKSENEILTMHTNFDNVKRSYQKMIFPTGKELIVKEKIEIDGLEVLRVSNGVISLETSVDFAPTLHSLKYKGEEWLDSSFPNISSKAWWKPWYGGISTSFGSLESKTILAEKRSAKFITKSDSLGNRWEGFCLTLNIEKNEKYRGIKIIQYFLLLPGSPVLFHTTKIEQNCGKFLHKESIETANFFGTNFFGTNFFETNDFETNSFGTNAFGKKLEQKKYSILVENCKGQNIEANTGEKSFFIESKSPLVIKNGENKEMLQVYLPSEDTSAYFSMNSQFLVSWIIDRFSCEDKAAKYIKSRFYIFAKDLLKRNLLADLRNVKFEDI